MVVIMEMFHVNMFVLDGESFMNLQFDLAGQLTTLQVIEPSYC